MPFPVALPSCPIQHSPCNTGFLNMHFLNMHFLNMGFFSISHNNAGTK